MPRQGLVQSGLPWGLGDGVGNRIEPDCVTGTGVTRLETRQDLCSFMATAKFLESCWDWSRGRGMTGPESSGWGGGRQPGLVQGRAGSR